MGKNIVSILKIFVGEKNGQKLHLTIEPLYRCNCLIGGKSSQSTLRLMIALGVEITYEMEIKISNF